MTKISYLNRSLASQFSKVRFMCPNCGADAPRNSVDRKYVITQLRRCTNCKMMFRTPTDDPADNASFYESEYTQGFTTELPSDQLLSDLKRTNFAGTEKDYSYYIAVLAKLGLGPGNRIFDYGCSWGYGSYQFLRTGFDVMSFEVAPGRKRFAHEKLGIPMADDMNSAVRKFPGAFDCFFSAHVLEHVPSPALSLSFSYALKLLKPNGLFVSFTPNGSAAHRARSPTWSKLWGEVHPNFIDDIFLDRSFRLSPRALGSSPVLDVALPAKGELNRLDDLQGDELFFVARKTGDSWN
jgi:2-polyprenyl-3-methyl-5-hydroxy-6-metoxy-1,4-benzoquinol methylase